MLHVSTKGDYGLLFLSLLALEDKAVSVRWASKELKVPYKYLGRIALELKKAGLIKSREGRTGGYRLARPAEKISLKEILRVLEGETRIRCQAGKYCPAEENCRVGRLWRVVGSGVDEVLERFTLADL
jgi:Rrf2 family protein